MRSSRILTLTLVFAIVLTNVGSVKCAGFDHSLFNSVLKAHVAKGKVDYTSIKTDVRFEKYMLTFKNFDPSQLNSREKLAFWINTYNSWTIAIICKNYPVTSIMELDSSGKIGGRGRVWEGKLVNVYGKKYSLNEIERDICLKLDVRSHFALVCAAKGCPELRSESYSKEKLDQQLTSQTQVFLLNSGKNSFDFEKKTASLSMLFEWYRSDFGGNDRSILGYVVGYLPASQAQIIRVHIESWKVQFKEYDWNLND